MTETILRAHARREELTTEIRSVSEKLRQREREVGVAMVTEGRTAADERLADLRDRRRSLMDELRLLNVGVEFARHPHAEGSPR